MLQTCMKQRCIGQDQHREQLSFQLFCDSDTNTTISYGEETSMDKVDEYAKGLPDPIARMAA